MVKLWFQESSVKTNDCHQRHLRTGLTSKQATLRLLFCPKVIGNRQTGRSCQFHRRSFRNIPYYCAILSINIFHADLLTILHLDLESISIVICMIMSHLFMYSFIENDRPDIQILVTLRPVLSWRHDFEWKCAMYYSSIAHCFHRLQDEDLHIFNDGKSKQVLRQNYIQATESKISKILPQRSWMIFSFYATSCLS